MKIVIGKQRLDFDVGDDEKTILEKYAFAQRDGSLPSYFRFESSLEPKSLETKDGALASEIKLRIEDIRDLLEEIKTDEDLARKETIEKLLSMYGFITRKEIVILWCIIHDVPDSTEYVSKVSKEFIDLKVLKAEVANHDKHAETVLTRIGNRLKLRSQMIEELTDVEIDNYRIGDLVMEGITELVALEFVNKERMIDIFDIIEPSIDINYVYLLDTPMGMESNEYVKTWKHISSDIETDPLVSFKQVELLRNYMYLVIKGSHVLWKHDLESETHYLEILKPIKGSDPIPLLKNSIGDRGEFKVLSRRQLSVKSKFTIYNSSIYRPIFAHLVTNDEVLSYFLFFKERETFSKN